MKNIFIIILLFVFLFSLKFVESKEYLVVNITRIPADIFLDGIYNKTILIDYNSLDGINPKTSRIIENIVPGKHIIKAIKFGYVTNMQTVDIIPNPSIEFNMHVVNMNMLPVLVRLVL